MANERQQVEQAHRGSEALADEVEGRPPAHRGDPAGHLGVHEDADDPDDDHPAQGHAEPGADLRRW